MEEAALGRLSVVGPLRVGDRLLLGGCFCNQLLLLNDYLVLTKPLSHDIQCQRCVIVKVGCKYLDNLELKFTSPTLDDGSTKFPAILGPSNVRRSGTKLEPLSEFMEHLSSTDRQSIRERCSL